jgi:hypothetical protein
VSLNRAEQQRTNDERRADQQLCGVTVRTLAEQLGSTTRQVEHTLAVDEACAPQDVRLLRDHLEDLVPAQGGTPVHYRVLTEQARPWRTTVRPSPRKPNTPMTRQGIPHHD